MAITLTTNNVSGAGFIANGYSADWSGCETIVAGVAGKSIYIEMICINVQEANEQVSLNFTFGAGETAGAVTATVLGPLICSADIVEKFVFSRPLPIAVATDLVVDATTAGKATIIVQGFIK